MIKVNSRQEILDLGEIWWDEPDTIRINRYGIFHLKDDNYPKYFEYYEPYDTHYCGNYYECSQEEYKEFLEKCINEYSEKIKKLQKMLDNKN